MKGERFDIHQHITDQIITAIERGASGIGALMFWGLIAAAGGLAMLFGWGK